MERGSTVSGSEWSLHVDPLAEKGEVVAISAATAAGSDTPRGNAAMQDVYRLLIDQDLDLGHVIVEEDAHIPDQEVAPDPDPETDQAASVARQVDPDPAHLKGEARGDQDQDLQTGEASPAHAPEVDRVLRADQKVAQKVQLKVVRKVAQKVALKADLEVVPRTSQRANPKVAQKVSRKVALEVAPDRRVQW